MDIKLVIIVENKGSSPVEAPNDMLGGDFLQDIKHSANVKGDWVLFSKEHNRELDVKLTLKDNDLHDGYNLILRPAPPVIVPQPDPVRTSPPPTWLQWCRDHALGVIAALLVVFAAGFLIGSGVDSGSGGQVGQLEARISRLEASLAAAQNRFNQVQGQLTKSQQQVQALRQQLQVCQQIVSSNNLNQNRELMRRCLTRQ